MDDSRIRGLRAVTHIQLQNSPSDSGLSTQRLHGSGDNSVKDGSSHTYSPVQDHDGSASEIRGRIFSSRDSLLNRFWVWEVLSIAVATVALAAMFITLLLHQDRTLPKWPSMITINALIAIFSAILKACLMMPIAEGLSQLKWLWYEKSRPMKLIAQWDMASRGSSAHLMFSLGSVTALYDLGFQPTFAVPVGIPSPDFHPQGPESRRVRRHSYSFRHGLMAHDEVGAISFSNNYTDGIMGRPSGTPAIEPQMQSAIYAGLLDPPSNVSAAVSYTCRTGNCAFTATEDGATSCHFRYKASTYTYKTASLLEYDIALDNITNNVMQSGVRRSSNGTPSNFLAKISFMMASTVSNKSMKAFGGESFPAVTTWSSNVMNGVLVEHVVETQRMDVELIPFATHSIFRANRTIRNGITIYRSSHFPQALVPLLDRGIEVLTNKSSNYWNYTTWWPSDCIYSILYAPTAGLAAVISSLLGNKTLWWDPYEQGYRQPLAGGNATRDTVQHAMRGLADSITARWRNGDGDKSIRVGPARGIVWEQQTCVHVNWAWLSLPAAMVLLTAVFLALIIIQTSVSDRPPWKSSMLATLFNGLDAKTRNAAGPVMSLQEMQVAADTTNMQLKMTQGGFRLAGSS
ncbi:hypothetical protein GCG54_00010591 [Colletotrichum gloeosporioides]|uniref:Uncharacterized protein n=1 Tax=Colletotrichum gloeosporioides TaxID=474922 RepID=A0A8H4FFB3_COLGL|nr:uncharacterized protein GCG54_00010591 [Colletotrichum gloeosporioides]KAF3798919.1 hypothetical protein GCG54_00010591 [Colletotrichum gloeosporioides]